MANESVTGKRVLVVEDEFDFADLLRSILERAGYTVMTAYNGEHAYSQVQKARPDLITLDIQMPKESGLFFYRKLKADEAFRNIPVVVVTGLTKDDRDWENLIRTFMEPEHVPHPEAYVEKPVDEPRFLITIEEALSCPTSGEC